ncbi:hypothetical protein G6F31_019528 [Rhizopus arrhizus]|nr:hypothetical protein G6F31_019528 [Rhizopus arrhizus]
MGDGGAVPVRKRHIHGLQFVQRVMPRFPAGREVGAGSPREVAHVVQGDAVAVDLAVRLPRHFRNPVAVIGRPDGVPPRQQRHDRRGDSVGSRLPGRPGQRGDSG